MTDLTGVRVLVVEDELLVAATIEEILRRAGCEIVGPVPRVARALEAVAAGAFDIAVLDVNLAGQPVFPVADALAERRLPFVFVTGYGANLMPVRHNGRPVIAKPCKPRDLVDWLAAALEKSRAAK